jgi:hypothetical protein
MLLELLQVMAQKLTTRELLMKQLLALTVFSPVKALLLMI